ncbi:DUF3667 domain-containing protein [Henriciella litoralis]|uniref:DUF3667 domain-containing protein n=1 Tax=Henriciella litoralis TaxID=568102 RepID=UPI0009FE33AE|nr:DUF3667 domain-containing protein [Henriciella litoralis]
MSAEMETAAAASVGGLSAGGKSDLSGQPCRNCGELVAKRHCPVCGQLAASFHRPFLGLIIDTISDSFALDGRIAKTLPLLFFRPGRLSRRYSEGKRARYVPPFRLFLLSSLIFYFVVFLFADRAGWIDEIVQVGESGREARIEVTDEQLGALRERLANAETEVEADTLRRLLEQAEGLRNAEAAVDAATIGVQDETVAMDAGASEDAAPSDEEDAQGAASSSSTGEALENAARRVADNPRLFFAAIESWAPRLSLLFVPMTVLALSILYAWRRKYYIYDHAIHALHLHTWMYMMATIAFLVSPWLGGWAPGLLFLILPIYVVLSFRGAYGSGYVTAFLRFLFLSFVWLIGAIFLFTSVLIVSALSV